ncbi:cytochrome P450 [Rhodocollybia butyracea]|uniref:Cytochrome P450 n=1 Tax=Rhodocollybia butyracea TaxID=206335 RepID=A0A9P5PS30_9AGAR|nr:cytochrome P450 [Rhodocollybia butyracea]
MNGNSYSFPLSAFILGMSYLFWKYMQHKWSTAQKLPMPYSKQTSWIWGHELEIFQHEAYEMYIEWAASVGLVYRTKAALFQSNIIIVGDNVAAHHILQNAYSYVKAAGYRRVITRLIGKGLAGAEGEDHRYQRKLLAPAFTSGTVEAMTDDIISCVDQMTRNLRSAVETTNNDVLDFVPIMSACTLDIIGRVCFGHDFKGGESSEAKAIISAWHHDVAVSRTFAGFLAPILINIFPWITRLPIPAFRDGVVGRTIHQLAGKLITDSSENADAFHGKDILSILINRNNSEARLTTTELLDNIATFLVAGHETIAFILLHVARNLSIQSKLQQEIRTGTSVDYNRILELEYLNAVVKEGLRLHPVGATPDRIALYDDVIPLNQALRTESGGNGILILC